MGEETATDDLLMRELEAVIAYLYTDRPIGAVWRNRIRLVLEDYREALEDTL